MQLHLLTHQAFSAFYGTNRVIILDPSLTGSTLPTFDGVCFLWLGGDGALYASVDEIGANPKLVAAIGAPAGVIGIIGRFKNASHITGWAKWFEEQTGRPAPPVCLIDSRKTEIELYQAIAGCLAKDAAASRTMAADTEKDLAFLRRDFEKSLINLEKARRLMQGVGFDTRFMTLSVPLGEETIGPSDKDVASPLSPYVRSFGLPVDAAGIAGISLHCQITGTDRASGTFCVRVNRVVDNLCIGTSHLRFSDMDSGWLYFGLERTMQRSFGDAYLTLEWEPDSAGALPVITLSGLELETRQKGQKTKLPAMRIWSGFAPGELGDPQQFIPMNAPRRFARFADLSLYATPISKSAVHSPVEEVGTSLQTHLAETGPAGLAFEGTISPLASRVEVEFETAHENGPECLYLLMVTKSTARPTVDEIDRFLSELKTGKKPDDHPDFIASYKLVAPGQRHSFAVSLPCGFASDQASNLYVAVVSTTGKQDYGWCRWHNLAVSIPVSAIGEPEGRPGTIEVAPAQRVRSVKFPEIGDQLEFLAGTAKLQALSASLGFSPMIVADDNGSLQTHPLLGDVSAVLYRKALLAGVNRVACDVETAHEQSPDFQYVLALMPSDTENKYDAFKAALGRSVAADTRLSRGTDTESGIIYCVRKLSALDVSTISIDLDTPLEAPYDIIVAALPVEGIVSYGWCRWMSLSISSVMDWQQEYPLLTGTEQG